MKENEKINIDDGFTYSLDDSVDVTDWFCYSENHPKLIQVSERMNQHLSNNNFEDATTNMRLAIEYMVLQYVKEYRQDLYPENLATKITELRNANLISEETADLWHEIRVLANKVGAHINEDPIDVEKVILCGDKMPIAQNEFCGKFPYPSTKEISQQYLNASPKGAVKAQMWHSVNVDELKKRPDIKNAYVTGYKLNVVRVFEDGVIATLILDNEQALYNVIGSTFEEGIEIQRRTKEYNKKRHAESEAARKTKNRNIIILIVVILAALLITDSFLWTGLAGVIAYNLLKKGLTK